MVSIQASAQLQESPLAYAIASEILPRRWRPGAQAILSAASAAGALFTLLVGAKIAGSSLDGWRTFYYILGGLDIVAALVFIFAYNAPPLPLQASLSTRQKFARLDWIGYAFFVPGLVLLLMGLIWSKNPYPWTDSHVLAPFIVGLVLLILFALYEWKCKKDDVIHHDLFNPSVFFSVSVYYVFEMSVIYDENSYIAAVRFAVAFLISVPGAVCVAFYVSRSRKLKTPSVIGFVFFTVFLILMATARVSDGTAMWGYSVFIGLGIGSVLTTLVTAIQLSAPPKLIAVSSGLTLAIRSFGGAVGLAIYTSIFDAQLSSELPQKIASATIPLGLSQTSVGLLIKALAQNDQAALMKIPGITSAIIDAAVSALKQAYLVSFRYIWIAAAAFSLLAIIASVFLVNPHGEMTMHIDAPLDEEVSTVDAVSNELA
ncbi:hypothetical protein KCU62_g5356, partial [Aureobasidium sp. EXF-3399]